MNPTDGPWRRGWKRFPFGLLGMLVLMAATERFVRKHDLDALDHDDWRYHLSRQEFPRAARDKDLLYFGDSLMLLGVEPSVVERRSGWSGYNLAISAAQPSAAYFAFRKALDAGARPKAVVLECHWRLVASKPEERTQNWPHLLGYRESLDLAWQARDAALFGALVVRKTLPSMRGRNELRKWIVTTVNGKLHGVHSQMTLIMPHWRNHQGAQIVPSRHTDTWDTLAHARSMYPADWQPHPVNVAYLRRFFALAEERGVAVYWLLPPIHPRVLEANERSGVNAKHEAFVRSFQTRFPHLVVLDGRRAGYDPGVFFDPDHLGREGAFVLSQDLGDLLRRPATTDRWRRFSPLSRPSRRAGAGRRSLRRPHRNPRSNHHPLMENSAGKRQPRGPSCRQFASPLGSEAGSR